MNKRFYITLVMFAVVCAACFWNTMYFSDLTTELYEYIEYAEQSVEFDIEKAEEYLEKAQNYIYSKKTYLSAVMVHHGANDVGGSLILVRSYLKERDMPSFWAELKHLKFMITNLKESDAIQFGNIL